MPKGTNSRQSFSKTATVATKKTAAAVAATAAVVAAAAAGATQTTFNAGGGDPVVALRQEFTSLHNEASELLDAATAAGRELTAEELTANTQRFERMDSIKRLLDDKKRLAELAFTEIVGEEAEEAPVVELPAENPGAAASGSPSRKFTAGGIVVRDPNSIIVVGETRVDRREFTRAVNDWARTGVMPQRFATITTASASGIFLPKTVANPIVPTYVNAIREAHSILGVDVLSTGSTEEIDYPVLSATAGGLVAENATAETENEPSLTNAIKLVCSTYQSGSCYFSNMQLAATAFDLYSATLPALAFSKELGLESAIMAAIIADAGITQTVTQATNASITYANLVSLNRKLPKKYDFMKFICLSSDTYSLAEGLVDSQGRPILTWIDPQRTQLKFFNGTPVIRSDYLQAQGTNAHVTGFVASLLGFKLRDAGQAQVTRYTQVPAKPNQTGFNMFAYHAYGYDANAIAALHSS